MDLKQLRILLTIAETGSVTRAAETLHTVQPALSRQLKLLEEELGVTLFERERHGMVLTEPGRKFAERARRALKELDAGKQELNPRRQQVAGSVSVGFLPSAADALVTTLMGRVRQTYPLVQLRSHIAYVDDLRRSLETGEVDISLAFLRQEDADRLHALPVLVEEMYLVGPADAALDLKCPIPVHDLGGLPLILPSPAQGIRALVERECTAAGVSLNVVAETNSMNVQKSLVLNGEGLSILSGLVIADEVLRGQLTACPIEGVSLLRTLFLVRTPIRTLSDAASKVLEELKTGVRQHVADGRWPGATLVKLPN